MPFLIFSLPGDVMDVAADVDVALHSMLSNLLSELFPLFFDPPSEPASSGIANFDGSCNEDP